MNVLIVSSEFPPGPGGIGSHAYELTTNLIQLGNSVTVVAEQNYKSLPEVVEFNTKQLFPIISFPSKGNIVINVIRRFYLLMKTFYNQHWDIVLASGAKSIWLTMFIRLFMRTRLVLVIHGSEITSKAYLRKNLTLLGCSIADRIICVSAYSASHLTHKVTSSKITVIGNGASSQKFYAMYQNHLLKEKYKYHNSKILLTVGAVSERKGQDVVIKAMTEIVKSIPEVLYLVAGRSSNLDYYKGLAEEHKVSDHVEFLGVLSDAQLLHLYNLADLFVITSRHSSSGDFEGFGMVVIEAALCGLPSVVTKNSGLEEAIVDGVTGLAVPENDIQATASAIIELLKNDRLRAQMAEDARDRAEREFKWSIVAKKYQQILSEMI